MKLRLRQIRVGIYLLGLVLISGWIGWNIGRNSVIDRASVLVDRTKPQSKAKINLDLFWEVWDKLEQSYLIKEDLKPQEMVWGAISGMTSALGDPYTVFLPPKENKATKEELNGLFEGIGIELGFKDKILAVIAPLAGTPAEAAGIRAGDYILRLKDEAKGIDRDTDGLSLPEAVEIIRGPKGSPIILTILREGEPEPKEVEIVRDSIVIKSVELVWTGKNQDIALVKLSRFGGQTEKEWNEAVNQILAKKQQVKGIILDLRNNPGGYLQGAVHFGGEFLRKGQVVVQQENSQGKIETYSVLKDGRLLSQKLIVLINSGSASSSEILAGALRDYQRAKIIGEKSFGKGTIQEALDLGGGAGLHITTAKWLLPKGQWVNETKGIVPDIEVKADKNTDKDVQLMRAIEELEK